MSGQLISGIDKTTRTTFEVDIVKLQTARPQSPLKTIHHKKIIVALWAIFIGGGFAVFFLFYAAKIDTFGWFGDLPTLERLERPEPDLSSELLSSDGVTLGKYFRHNRTAVTYEELSPELINTLLVTEDIRFEAHSGIDLKGLVRAAFGLLTFNFKGGGSTITMQLAENLYGTATTNQGALYAIKPIGRLITKVKEWIIAIQLEAYFTKKEILAMYLNTIEYGANAYGIKVASKTFFNKLPSALGYKEAALLIGLINAPTRYNPIRNPENAFAKRAEILYNLYKYEKINRTAYDSLKVSDFGLSYKVQNQNQGLATYFRSVIKSYLMYWCKKNGYDLFADGLKIYTTIDSRMQHYAEQAVVEEMQKLQSVFIRHLNGSAPWVDSKGQEMTDYIDIAIRRTPHYKQLAKRYGEDSDSLRHYLHLPKPMSVFSWQGERDTTMSPIDSLKYYKHFLQAGLMAMDPHTGAIKAWVGGINHKYFKFDHVKQSKRQPGSTFKPFVYAAAIDLGYSPCYTAIDAPVTWMLNDPEKPTWTPQNADGKFTGKTMTIRQAMARSVNSITARIMQKITPQAAVDMARSLGISSPLQAVPALSLGAGGEVSLYEMVGAYATFVNHGVWTAPFYITRIEDKNGVVIKNFAPKRREAISEKTAYLMIHMLKGATEEKGGSARGLDYSLKVDNEIGAKTGTTQNASDGWFIGATHDLVTGVWTGGDDRSIHFKSWVLGQGSRTARPVWQNFMLKVYNDPQTGIRKGYFNPPTTPLGVTLDCDQYEGKAPEIDSLNNDMHQLEEDFQTLDF